MNGMALRRLLLTLRRALPPMLVMYAAVFGGNVSGLIYDQTKWFSLALITLAAPFALRHTERPYAVIPLTGLAAAMAVSYLFAPGYLGAWLLLLWAGVVITIWMSGAVETAQLERALMAIFAALALVALYDIVRWLAQGGFLLAALPRSSSVLWNPNLLGPVMMLGLALALRTRRWVWLAVFAAVMASTGSRATLLGIAAGAALLVVLHLPRLRPTRTQVFIGLGAALALLPLIVLQAVNPTHAPLELREDLWRTAAITFWRHPLTGIGPERYRVAFLELARLSHTTTHQHAHNLYLQVAAETGTLGLLALGGLAVAAMRRIWQTFRAGHVREASLAAALMAALAAQGLLDYVYWVLSLVLLVVWIGRVLLTPRSPESAPTLAELITRPHAPTLITALLGFPAIVLGHSLDHRLGLLHQAATGMAFLLACALYAAMASPPPQADEGSDYRAGRGRFLDGRLRIYILWFLSLTTPTR